MAGEQGDEERRSGSALGSDEGEFRQFSGAVQAEGQAYRTDAAIYVELHVLELEHAFYILLSHGRQD